MGILGKEKQCTLKHSYRMARLNKHGMIKMTNPTLSFALCKVEDVFLGGAVHNGRTGSSSSSLLLREESEDEVKGLP